MEKPRCRLKEIPLNQPHCSKEICRHPIRNGIHLLHQPADVALVLAEEERSASHRLARQHVGEPITHHVRRPQIDAQLQCGVLEEAGLWLTAVTDHPVRDQAGLRMMQAVVDGVQSGSALL